MIHMPHANCRAAPQHGVPVPSAWAAEYRYGISTRYFVHEGAPDDIRLFASNLRSSGHDFAKFGSARLW